MRKHAGVLASFVILRVAAVIGSCRKPYHEEPERYVFVEPNIVLPYWEEAQAGFLDAAKQLGVKAELIGPVKYDPASEAGMFQDLVEQHPAGICLSAARPEMFKARIDKAISEGIPVICVDADVPDSRRVLYIGRDNLKAGRGSLKRMAALVAGKGNIVVVTIPGPANMAHRLSGGVGAL